MRKNSEVTVRKVGRQYMIVKPSENSVDLSTVYTMNATAAYLWDCAGEEDFTAEMLVQSLCELYDVEPEVAAPDVERLIQEWQRLGLV